MQRIRSLVVGLMFLLLFACKAEERSKESFPDAPVILISIDTLRSDHLPVYGYAGVATPNIDQLRRDGILFERAYSHCPMTLPSHVSMLTGLLPTEHQVRNNIGYRYDAGRNNSLPQLLADRGYQTGASVSSYVLRADTGMAEMFAEYDDEIAVGTAGAASQYQREGGRAVAFAKKWVSERAGKPLFFMLHLYEPHAPYDPPEPWRSRYSNRYDGEIAASDALVGEFLDELRARGIYDKAIIILTSDHGEGLMDHGEDQHGILLYREAIQVPLIVKLPGNTHSGITVADPVQHIDIAPTVLELLEVDSPFQSKGSSLIKFLEGSSGAERTIYSETLYPRIHLGWSELRSVISGSNHYISGPKPELYSLIVDPAEKQNLIASERRKAAALRASLEQFPAAIDQIGEIDPEEARKLAALGYLGAPRTVSNSAALPNPAEEIHNLDRIKEAFRLADEGRHEGAIQRFQALLTSNPGLSDVRDKLGASLMALGRYDEAIDVYREAIHRSERFSPDLALSMANACLQAERLKEARDYADLALTSNPMRAHEMLARVALQRGDLDEADRQASLAVDPRKAQPSIMLVQAEIRRARGDLEGALRVLDQAAGRASELGVSRLYRLHYLQGDILARLGREKEAEAAYRKAIAEFPEDVQSYANLSIIHFIQGKRDAMWETLNAMVKANPNRRAFELAADTLDSFELTAEAKAFRERVE